MKKNILILGGFGFIGSNLIEDFLKNGNFNVIVFEFRGLINRFADQIKVYYGDFNKEILNLLQNIAPNIEISYQPARNFDIPKIVLNVDKLTSMLDFSLTDLKKSHIFDLRLA